jgi:hypothetical protein
VGDTVIIAIQALVFEASDLQDHHSPKLGWQTWQRAVHHSPNHWMLHIVSHSTVTSLT